MLYINYLLTCPFLHIQSFLAKCNVCVPEKLCIWQNCTLKMTGLNWKIRLEKGIKNPSKPVTRTLAKTIIGTWGDKLGCQADNSA